MPRVLPIDTMTNRPICKSAGSGGGVGGRWNHLCHVRARVGVNGQCFTCNIPGLAVGYPKQIGCSAVGVPCGVSWKAGSYGN